MTYQQWLADAAQALNQVNPTENGKVDAFSAIATRNRANRERKF